jgi:hypothetical protein
MNRGVRTFLPAIVTSALLASAWYGCARPEHPAESTGPAGAWERLFDGRTLAGWAPSGFEGEGAVKVENLYQDDRPAIIIEEGMLLSGIRWTSGSTLPRTNYELALEAMRLEGADFFCALTFPVGSAACSLIVGGWGGTVVGLSSLDRLDASQNETSRHIDFADDRWYRIRVRVTDDRIEAWIDDEPVVAVATAGRTIGLRPGEIYKSLPLGIATFQTRAAIRDIRLRRLAPLKTTE